MAEKFVEHIKGKHNGLGYLLFCYNLSAHVSDKVKDVFHKGNVFLSYLPAQITELTQPMHAGYYRSLRCAIGNLLDQWLLSETNMENGKVK